jgi:hypothetical protein
MEQGGIKSRVELFNNALTILKVADGKTIWKTGQ